MNRKISPDDLRAVLGKREADKIINAVRAAQMEPLEPEFLHAFLALLNDEPVGRNSHRIARVLAAYLEDHPTAASRMRTWANEVLAAK
jgi:hypothetical protein